MTELRTRNVGAASINIWNRVSLSVRLIGALFALLVAIFSAEFVGPAYSANADWFIPKLEATEREDHIEVIVHVSASIGSSVLENHPLGTYQIPKDSRIRTTLEAGIATFNLNILVEGDLVFLVVDMLVPDAPPMKKISIAQLKK